MFIVIRQAEHRNDRYLHPEKYFHSQRRKAKLFNTLEEAQAEADRQQRKFKAYRFIVDVQN